MFAFKELKNAFTTQKVYLKKKNTCLIKNLNELLRVQNAKNDKNALSNLFLKHNPKHALNIAMPSSPKARSV
jgi:hypothetical protein